MIVSNTLKIKTPRHRCWWCKELFEEGEIRHYKSGWLCDRCKAYLQTQGGDTDG